MMLSPDVAYCLAIHPRHPHNNTTAYHTIKVAVLQLGCARLMRGTGLRGLTQHAVFRAVQRHTASSDDEVAATSTVRRRRLLLQQHKEGQQDDVVLIGAATPDMCWF